MLRGWLQRLLGQGQAPAEDRPGSEYFLESELAARIEALARAEQRPPADVAADLLNWELERRRQNEHLWELWDQLSRREQQVTALACLGFTNRRIGARLALSPDTVKGYLRNIFYKFDVHSKQELRWLFKEWDFSGWNDGG